MTFSQVVLSVRPVRESVLIRAERSRVLFNTQTNVQTRPQVTTSLVFAPPRGLTPGPTRAGEVPDSAEHVHLRGLLG